MDENNQNSENSELLDFFKALADANRLKIIGLLAQKPLSVEQIAEMVGLTSSTVSHHLSRLAKVGLVSAKAEGYYSMYQFEQKALEAMAQRLLVKETMPDAAMDVDTDAYDRKVLKAYMNPDGTFRSFPNQQKKMEAILRHVVKVFEPEVRYTEKQVNQLLSRFSDDTAILRRNLVDFGFMKRQASGGEYWLVEGK